MGVSQHKSSQSRPTPKGEAWIEVIITECNPSHMRKNGTAIMETDQKHNLGKIFLEILSHRRTTIYLS